MNKEGGWKMSLRDLMFELYLNREFACSMLKSLAALMKAFFIVCF